MRVSKLTAWNSVWLILAVCLLASGWWVWSSVAPSRGHLAYDDWPDGDTADKDRWRGGVFLGLRADRIRRVGEFHGDLIDADTISYFASIPATESEFQQRLQTWRARPDFSPRPPDDLPSSVPPHSPPWFPQRTLETYVGALTDESSWRVTIYRRRDDDHIYLHLR